MVESVTVQSDWNDLVDITIMTKFVIFLMCFILFLSQFIRLIGINCPFYITNLHLTLINELVVIFVDK